MRAIGNEGEKNVKGGVESEGEGEGEGEKKGKERS